MSFTCTDKDTLTAFLYDECDEATRGEITAHLAACPACADEVRGFAHVRETLARWVPPDRVGSYRLVREDAEAPRTATVLRPARWWQAPVSAAARVAAAILLFAGGAALANLDVRYDQNGFAVRTGWRAPAPVSIPAAGPAPARELATADRQGVPAAAPVTVAPPPAAQADSPWRFEMAALERNLRDEFRAQLAAARMSGGSFPIAMPADADAAEARLMTQVHQLIDDSYRRQQVEMAYRISQVERQFQAQRTAGAIGVSQPFNQLDGPPIYSPEQRLMMNYFRLNPVTLKK